MNKKGLSKLAITGIVLGVIVVLFLMSFAGTYNSLVSLDENVDAKFANVQSAYQRRADLIPNLVETVQGAADFESNTQTQIAELRTQAVAAKEEMNQASTPEEVKVAAAKSDQVLSSFRGLNINVENYPQLNANENFLSLQDELAGTENRVKTERDIYNDAVKQLNVKVRSFPSNIVAGMFGFEKEDLFEADAGTSSAPEVSFE